MSHQTRNARLTAPMPFQNSDGTTDVVPSGACMIEQLDDDHVDLIWGMDGECAIRLSVTEVKAAADGGLLVLVE